MHTPLSSDQINQLRSFDTCVISDAIETFGVRLRNEGFATAGFRCLFKSFPPMVGYAATCKIRSADPPIVGSRYVERTDWWKHITSIPSPRVVVMQDIDQEPGTGAFLGSCPRQHPEGVGLRRGGNERRRTRVAWNRSEWLSGLCRTARYLTCLCPHCRVWRSGGGRGAQDSTRRFNPRRPPRHYQRSPRHGN